MLRVRELEETVCGLGFGVGDNGFGCTVFVSGCAAVAGKMIHAVAVVTDDVSTWRRSCLSIRLPRSVTAVPAGSCVGREITCVGSSGVGVVHDNISIVLGSGLWLSPFVPLVPTE